MLMLGRLALVMIVLTPSAAHAEGLIRLVDPLDEPDGYCVDIPGFGRRLNLDAALMAHTCKPGAPDELFSVNLPSKGQIYMKAYDRCVTASSDKPGAQLSVKPCDSSRLQRFSFQPDGRIKLTDSEVCFAVAEGVGTPTGGPSHLRRDLSMESCDSAVPSLSRWAAPE